MFDGEIVKKNFPFQKILSRFSSALFLFVSDLLMLIITKLSIKTAIRCSQKTQYVGSHKNLLYEGLFPSCTGYTGVNR